MKPTPVPLDPEQIAQLSRYGDEVPVAGPDGTIAGYILSPRRFEMMRKALYDWAFAQFPPEEARRVFANPNKHSMDEVLKLLEEK